MAFDPRADSPCRCSWVGSDPLEQAYHDREWGVPCHDDPALFELITLEGAQAGLSWLTVLRKRERYRTRFCGFDPERVAALPDTALQDCLGDAGLIRHRGKIDSVRTNARAIVSLRERYGSLDAYLWAFVDDAPVIGGWPPDSRIPARTALSERVARALRAEGLRFMGPTTTQAFLQAAGLVMDHTTDCFRYPALADDRSPRTGPDPT